MKKYNISSYEAYKFKEYLLNGDGLVYENLSSVKKECKSLLKYDFISIKPFGVNVIVHATELGINYFNNI